MPRLDVTFTSSWLNHTPWSEKYVGLRKLAHDILPKNIWEMTAEDSTMCHSVIIGANQLMEMALFELIKEFVSSGVITQKEFKLPYHQALSTLPEKITGTKLCLSSEPFVSSEKLRQRRNATVHKTASLADVKMARSALYTAVISVKALFAHFGKPFPYAVFLEKYPLPAEMLFSEVIYPENYHSSRCDTVN